jgi:hypothetical protein
MCLLVRRRLGRDWFPGQTALRWGAGGSGLVALFLVVPAREPVLGSAAHHCGCKAAAWGYTEATRGGGLQTPHGLWKGPIADFRMGSPPEKQSAERGYGLSGRRIIPPSDLVYLVYPENPVKLPGPVGRCIYRPRKTRKTRSQISPVAAAVVKKPVYPQKLMYPSLGDPGP